jgi:hypothetical protein
MSAATLPCAVCCFEVCRRLLIPVGLHAVASAVARFVRPDQVLPPHIISRLQEGHTCIAEQHSQVRCCSWKIGGGSGVV